MLGQIRVVMRYAGARMLWHHPYLAVVHLLKSIMPANRHFQEAED
jgi:hypothetical protein